MLNLESTLTLWSAIILTGGLIIILTLFVKLCYKPINVPISVRYLEIIGYFLFVWGIFKYTYLISTETSLKKKDLHITTTTEDEE